MITLKYFTCIALFLLASKIYSQIPDTVWTKTFGGSEYDFAFTAEQTSDGGYIIVGGTGSFGLGGNGYTDTWLIRTDSNGDTIWTKTFGGIYSDDGFAVEQTLDSGFILTGDTYSFVTSSTDVYLIKTDNDGDTIWTKTYGGTESDMCWSVQQTKDSGYIMAGRTASFGSGSMDVFLIKTNNNGDTVWTRVFGSSNWDEAKSVKQSSDGGFIITGITESFGAGQSDIYLIKTNSDGDSMWTKTFGGSYQDEGFSVKQTLDGGYIISGRSESFGVGAMDVYLVKTDINGSLVWAKTFGGINNDAGFSVQQTSDSGYIITGRTESFGSGSGDIYLIKTDYIGEEMWTKTLGGNYWEVGYSVQETADSGYIIAGNTDSFGAGNLDVWLIRIGLDVSSVNILNESPLKYELSKNFPNPFNPFTTIRYEIPVRSFVNIKVYDLLGNEVETLVNDEKQTGTYEVEFGNVGTSRDLSLPSGIYFYQLRAGNYIETKKMLLLK